MPLSLKTMEVQIQGDQWNKRFRTVQVYWSIALMSTWYIFADQVFFKTLRFAAYSFVVLSS